MQWVDPEYATASPADAVASTLACRGYMWSNQHPAPFKFRPWRAPTPQVVARAAALNAAELLERLAAGRRELDPAALCAVQVLPYLRLITAAAPWHSSRLCLPMRWRRWWAGSVLEEHGSAAPPHEAPPSPRGGLLNMVGRDEDPIED
jgi:hypothetical protein